MILQIGNKPLKELTAEDLRQIVLIEGCSPSLEFWNEPEITRFNNTTFSDTIVIDYLAYRKDDFFYNKKSKDNGLYRDNFSVLIQRKPVNN